MALGSDFSVSETPTLLTVNNTQPVDKTLGLPSTDYEAGETNGGLFGTILGNLGLGDNLGDILKTGAEQKLKKELDLLPPKPVVKVITTNKTTVPDDLTTTKVLAKAKSNNNNIVYFLGGAGVLVIAFALIAKGR